MKKHSKFSINFIFSEFCVGKFFVFVYLVENMVVQNFDFSQYQLGRSKKYDQLSHWQLALQEISQYDLTPIENKVRKIRLEKLVKEVKTRLNNAKPKEPEPKPDPFEKLKESRKLGNQFSETNKFKFYTAFYKFKERREDPDTKEMKKLKARKSYGNKKSVENRKKIRKVKLTTSKPSVAEVVENKVTNKTHEYGDYYSNRFKVKSKLKREEYDLEFQQLIIECMEFEKNHEDVTSVIEEIINSKKSLKEEMIQILTNDGVKEENFKNEEKVDNSKLIPLPQSTKVSELFIDLKTSTLIQALSDGDDTSYTCSESENFNSLTKILGAKESNTRSYKYSIENTSLVSIEKPTDSDITDESRTSSPLRPCCSQDVPVEPIPAVCDFMKKDDRSLDNPESNDGMFDKVKSKILEGWNLKESVSAKNHLLQDKLAVLQDQPKSGNITNILDEKHSESTLKRIITALLNNND